MKNKAAFSLAAFIVLSLMIAACTYQAPTISPSDSQTQVALFAQATLTKGALLTQAAPTEAPADTEVPTESPTSPPPTATQIPPTPTQVPTVAITPIQPTATSVPPTATSSPLTATRLSFAAGTTNVYTEGSIPANTTKRYVLRAAKSQLFDVSLSSGQSASIAISSAAGTKLVDFSYGWTWYRDYLPEGGDWYVDVKAGASDVNFSLYIVIPQRLSFEAGEDSMIAEGTVPGGKVHNFIAWANKGQTLKLSVSPSSNLKLSIWHVDGTVLLSPMGDNSSYEGVLPLAGDYIINVISAAGSSATDFDLNLSIK